MRLTLDDDLPRRVPRVGLVHQREEQPLLHAGLLELLLGLCEQVGAGRFQPGIHRQAEGVREPPFRADAVHQRHAEGAVATHEDLDVGEPLADPPREIPQVVVRSERRRTGAVTPTHECDHVGLGTGDRDRQVLVLLVETVKEDQLLPAMRGVVEGIPVERDARRRGREGVQKLVAQRVPQSPEVGDRDGVAPPARGGSNRDSVGWLARSMSLGRRSHTNLNAGSLRSVS